MPLAQALTLFAVIVAWVPFRADNLATAGRCCVAMAGANGIALPSMIVGLLPPLAWIATPVPLLPWLGDARTLSFPGGHRVSGGRLVHRASCCPTPRMSGRGRSWALTAGFAFTVQALFFAPHVAPFLYFQF